jgi:hypothetical protein
MYYTSSEYYNGDIQCLICLSESKKNDVIKKMKDFSDLYIICDCNPTFHYTCLEVWIDRTSSCPICRKKIIIKIPNNNINTITHFIFYCDFNIFMLRIIAFVLTINIFLFFIYNCYFMNYMLHEYSYEYSYEYSNEYFNESTD